MALNIRLEQKRKAEEGEKAAGGKMRYKRKKT